MPRELDDRLFRLACRAVDRYELMNRRGGVAREVARQFVRAATSIGANYAEAAAGQTKADFVAKVSIARKECREALFWLRLIREKELAGGAGVDEEVNELRQIAAVLTAIVRKARESNLRGNGMP
jgi:four helix bundle protein